MSVACWGLVQVLGQPRLYSKTLTQRAKKDIWAGKEVGIPYSQGHRVIVAGKAFVLFMEQDREHAPKDTSQGLALVFAGGEGSPETSRFPNGLSYLCAHPQKGLHSYSTWLL